MPSFNLNPFAKRESHSALSLNVYRVLTPLSWALVVVFGIYYSIRAPADVKHGHRLWTQADKHETLFSQNVVVTAIYWILLLLSQLGYIGHLFSKDTAHVTAAANVAGYYIFNNLLVFAWIMLWVRNFFQGAEVILVAQTINQHVAYWCLRDLPTYVHLPAVAGPYAWALTALFWNGAVAVDSHTRQARIAANVFVWIMTVIGAGHVFVMQDHLLGYCLSLLGLSFAVKQFDIKADNLQWIFAWVAFAVFVVEALYALGTTSTGRNAFLRRTGEPDSTATDRERQPLLEEQTQ